MHSDIEDHFNRLCQLYRHADEIAVLEEVDEEIKAHFTYYLCVMTSGYIEASIKIIL